MKKIIAHILPFLIAIIAFVALAFSESERKEQLCVGVSVIVDEGNAKNSFITEADIMSVLKKELDSLHFRLVSDIPIYDIEKKLQSHPLIHSSNVFFRVDGSLHIHVKQRNPILRVESIHDSFYIDEQGRLMPLSRNYTARVIVATGNITSGYREKHNVFLEEGEHNTILKDLLTITQLIHSCSLLSRIIEQIHVTEDFNYILTSKIGPPIIHIGKAEYFDYKFKNLRAFYHSNKVKELWGAYREVNVTFRNQIICTKH